LRGLCGFCGWFNPSFIRIPVSFDLSAGLPNVVTRCKAKSSGSVWKSVG
jgi:hypothetical protein